VQLSSHNTHHNLDLRGVHHSPHYNILCDWQQRLHWNDQNSQFWQVMNYTNL